MRPPTIVVPFSPDREAGAQLAEATVAETHRALLCREFGVPDDADDEVLNAAIIAAGVRWKGYFDHGYVPEIVPESAAVPGKKEKEDAII